MSCATITPATITCCWKGPISSGLWRILNPSLKSWFSWTPWLRPASADQTVSGWWTLSPTFVGKLQKSAAQGCLCPAIQQLLLQVRRWLKNKITLRTFSLKKNLFHVFFFFLQLVSCSHSRSHSRSRSHRLHSPTHLPKVRHEKMKNNNDSKII